MSRYKWDLISIAAKVLVLAVAASRAGHFVYQTF
jgi:hypothetical protein